MASTSELNSFRNSWNQTAAWAQSKGIKYNDYFPIYQADTQRLLQYGTPMSPAERERAIVAASDPNAATQSTPSTAPNPGNVIGNTVTDLRNIFTGLGDIAIHPLHNGLVDSVKNTVDIIDGSHQLQGHSPGAKMGDALTSTVLSWVPGAADIGTVLNADPSLSGNAGAKALAEHPISSILDVLPLASKLTEIKVAGDASFAERTGLSVEEGPKPSIGRAVKGYLMNTPTGKIGPAGTMTVGDRFHALLGGSIIGTNPDIADAAMGTETIPNLYTSEERSLFSAYDKASENFTPQQTEQLSKLMDASQDTNLAERLKDPDLDPRVKEAANALVDGPLRFQTEEDIAAENGPTLVRDPRTGQVGVYSSTDHPVVVTSRDALARSTAKIVETLPELEKLRQQTDQGSQLLQQATDKLQQANETARQVKVEGNVTFRNTGDKRLTGFAKSRVADKMFGSGGFIDQLLTKAKAGNYEDTEFLANAALRRLDTWGTRSVDAADDPAFQAAREQVEQVAKAAKVMKHLTQKADKEVHGRAEAWKAGKGYRDDMHREQVRQMEEGHKQELRTIGQARKEQFARLKMAWTLKTRDIRTRYAKAKVERDAYLRDQTQEINERYGIEKAKVTTRHLLARETHAEWLKGRRAQGLPGSRDFIQGAQEGTRIAPGALGSKEAIEAGHTTLEAARLQELRDLEKSVPSRAELDAKMQGELKAAQLTENQMRQRLAKVYDKYQRDVVDRQKKDAKDLEKLHTGKKSREGRTSKAYNEWTKAQKAFSKAVWQHPPDNYVDLYFNLFAKHLVDNEKAADTLADNEKVLAEKYGWGDQSISDLRSNPQVMAQLVQLGIRGAFDHPVFNDIDKGIIKQAQNSALAELNRLRLEGIDPQYIPHVSSTQLKADATGSYGIRLLVGKGIPKPDAFSSRTWGMESSKYDLMAGIHRGVKQVLDRDATIDYVDQYLSPRVVTGEQLRDTVLSYYPEVSSLSGQAVTDFINARLKDWNLVQFDPNKMFGFSMPRWGSQSTYLDADLVRAVQKLTEGKSLPTAGVFDKATRLFRYSILGLSPRYTAHILFGGSFLLALRSSPHVFGQITDAWKALKTGELPENLLTSPTNLGTTDYEIRTPQQAVNDFGAASAKQQVRLMAQEHIEKIQGIRSVAAKPLHWAKALADINLHFTSQVVNMQRAIAYLDGAAKAERHGVTDEWGNPVEMSKERMMEEGMNHAAAVMGDLRRMSPFERQVARTWVPFYGWEKHILQYVLSFPADHPWRAMMLSQMAEYDTEHTPAGLPSRYQFLFFLGGPDAQGNASVVDLRAVNPLRDVANYATIGGIISSVNPVVSAGVSMVDPDIIYGGNELYPNVTYDQFYGIEEAGPQGNLLTAASQIVPQVSAMQSALQLAGQRQGMSGSSLVKNIYESLNIPMVQVQHINLKQEAAKTAIAQYQVTKSLAANAWQTGDFQSIEDLGSVPDPRNPDYETPVSELQSLYQTLSEDYPGQPPEDTAQPLPSVHL